MSLFFIKLVIKNVSIKSRFIFFEENEWEKDLANGIKCR